MTDENPRFVRDEPTDDPRVDPAASRPTQPGGFGDAFEDRINYGLYNGVFAKGPPIPANNIDPWNSAGSNFMPNWRFVQSSNTNITAKQVRDTGSPSGSNLRFTFVSGAAADEALVEQIVPIGGFRSRQSGDFLFAGLAAGAANTGTFDFTLRGDYLTVDYVPTGVFQSVAVNLPAGTTGFGHPLNMPTPPATAYYLRAWLIVDRGSAANGAVGTIDVTEVRHSPALRTLMLADQGDPATYDVGLISQNTGYIDFAPASVIGMSLSAAGLDLGVAGNFFAAVALSGVITPTALSAATNDWNPTDLDIAVVIRASSDANRNLSGIVAPTTSRWLRIYNVGAFNITLVDNATSTAANRFLCPNVANLTLNPQDSADLWYDLDSARWRVLGT